MGWKFRRQKGYSLSRPRVFVLQGKNIGIHFSALYFLTSMLTMQHHTSKSESEYVCFNLTSMVFVFSFIIVCKTIRLVLVEEAESGVWDTGK